MASVQLFLHVSGTLVDLNDEIYTADVKFGESLNFSLKKSQLYKLKSSTDSEPFLSMKEVTILCRGFEGFTNGGRGDC